MSKLIFILGGARSGKSTLARKIISKEQGKKVFLATAEASDILMIAKIKRHQKERDKSWSTIEQFCNFKKLNDDPSFVQAQNVLIDCITLLVNNQMRKFEINWDDLNLNTVEKIYSVEESILNSITELLDICENKTTVIVSNEVGMGIVPDNMYANYYRDILGRVNQLIAKRADSVYFMIAGLPLLIKGEKSEFI